MLHETLLNIAFEADGTHLSAPAVDASNSATNEIWYKPEDVQVVTCEVKDWNGKFGFINFRGSRVFLHSDCGLEGFHLGTQMEVCLTALHIARGEKGPYVIGAHPKGIYETLEAQRAGGGIDSLMLRIAPKEISILTEPETVKVAEPLAAWTFRLGKIEAGILTEFHTLGGKNATKVQGIGLGDDGRGRKLTVVRLDNRNPAQVDADSRVQKVVIHPVVRDGFTPFYTLKSPDPKQNQNPTRDAVLIRVDTGGPYTKGSRGCWEAIKGKVEQVGSGWTARGLAGRIGSADDSLIVLHQGAVVKVMPEGGHKTISYALFLDESGNPKAVDYDEWQAAKATSEVQKPNAEIPLAYQSMPVYAFGMRGEEGWGLLQGIDAHQITDGRGFQLGPRKTGWRESKKVTVGVAVNLPEQVKNAAVARVGKKIVLVPSESFEMGKYLVRIDTDGLRKGGHTSATSYRGKPDLLTEGYMEIGTANVQHHRDQLWVITDDQVLRIGQTSGEGKNDYVLYAKDGELVCERLRDWQLRDAKVHPDEYLKRNLALREMVPAEWLGRVVEVLDNKQEETNYVTYHIVSLQPLVGDSAWDKLTPPDYNSREELKRAVWLRLRTDLESLAEKEVKTVTETLKFGEPPLPDGTRVIARIRTEKVHHEATSGYYGREAYDEIVYYVEVDEVRAQKIRATEYEVSGQKREEKEDLGEVETIWTLKESANKNFGTKILAIPEEMTEINGEFAVEFWEGRRGGWGLTILTPEMLENERVEILAVVTENLPVRKLARKINDEGAYGMPVDAEGNPCDPAQAVQWVMYMADHRWSNAYPDAFVVTSMKGFRSKSTGVTFEALVKEYNR